MKKLFLTLASTFICFAASLSAQTVVGTWKTIDDETKEAKSYVEVFENNGKLYGKITKLLLKPADTVCMIIVSDLSLKDGYYQGGSILDPTKGDYYKCSLWLQAGDANVMNVKGKHWSGISRTQKWYRVN
jgi:uncharacterized protein (DUF2147 family)